MKARIFGCISCSLVVVGSLFACSTSSSGGNAGACGNLANALLAYSQRCGGGYDPARTNDLASRYTQLCQAEFSLPGVPDDSSQLNACASALGSASCNSLGQIDACNVAQTGSLAAGAACSESLQCQSGSCSAATISVSADGGTSNCGTCQPSIADGQPCTGGGVCVQGDTCTFSSDGGLQTETCQKKPSPGDVGAACTSNTGCKSPNHCLLADTNGTVSGSCTAPVASGGACTANGDCASGLDCTGTTTRTCGAPVAQGGACLSNNSDCAAGLACDATTQKCVTVTFAAAGAACDGNVTRCSHGNCVFAATPGGAPNGTGTCPTIIADGQPCTGNSSSGAAQCDDFASCTNGKCTLVPASCN